MSATATVPVERPRRTGLVGPIVLVGLGVVLLLNNLGMLNWSVWGTLLRFWPLLLIAVGLDLLFGRRSYIVSLLIALVLLAALFAGIWWSGALAPPPGIVVTPVAVPLNDASRGRAMIDLGVGTLDLAAQPDAAGFVSGSLRDRENGIVRNEATRAGDTAIFTLQSRQGPWAPAVTSAGQEPRWTLRFNSAIPLTLEIKTGVGQATLDLRNLKAEQLTLNGGVGSTTVTLPERGELHGAISGGVGSTMVVVPAGVALRVNANAGVGEVTIFGQRQRSGVPYATPGYDSAANRADLNISSGVGSVTIVRESDR